MEKGASRQRTDTALGRITLENGHSRIFTAVDAENARATAEASDERAATGKRLSPLDGMLVAVKDNLAVQGLPWTAGIGALRHRIAESDADVVANLRQAGAIILGTVNMHEGALGATNDNPHFGRCQNPLRDGFTPGGSSGGSGAAIAADLVDIALGTDTMGSVRIPAAYCGAFGLKTTDGSLSRNGLTFLSPTLDTIGLIARTPALLAPAHAAMAGIALPSPVEASSPIRLAIPHQMTDVAVTPEVGGAFERATELLRHAGVIIETIDLEGWSPARSKRGGLLVIETEAAREMPMFLQADLEGVSPEFRNYLTYGAGLSADRIVDAYDRIKQAGDACRRALTHFDGILLPTAPQTAFSFADPIPENQADFTCLANFEGRPAIAVPISTTPGHLPASVQIIGRPFSEPLLCEIAELFVSRDQII